MPQSNPKPAPHGHRHASVLDDLGLRITAADLPAGTILTIDKIAEDHGVSIPVSREAVRVLSSMGLVTSRRRVGITVLPASKWNLFDPQVIRWRLAGRDRSQQLISLGELRLGIEPTAASLAAERATSEQHQQLLVSAAAMAASGAAGDLDAYLEADTAFHDTLLRASGNEMLASLTGLVHEVLAGRTHHHLMPAQPNPEAIELHRLVAVAVGEGDAETASRAMRLIIDEAAQAVRTLANEDAAPDSHVG